mmetsp:Transcript_405/g.812  ORF Transcript_405/g.812 Transcript_405/m.812 type:complete len:201 (-) Transcript_405:53-655(-)
MNRGPPKHIPSVHQHFGHPIVSCSCTFCSSSCLLFLLPPREFGQHSLGALHIAESGGCTQRDDEVERRRRSVAELHPRQERREKCVLHRRDEASFVQRSRARCFGQQRHVRPGIHQSQHAESHLISASAGVVQCCQIGFVFLRVDVSLCCNKQIDGVRCFALRCCDQCRLFSTSFIIDYDPILFQQLLDCFCVVLGSCLK